MSPITDRLLLSNRNDIIKVDCTLRLDRMGVILCLEDGPEQEKRNNIVIARFDDWRMSQAGVFDFPMD